MLFTCYHYCLLTAAAPGSTNKVSIKPAVIKTEEESKSLPTARKNSIFQQFSSKIYRIILRIAKNLFINSNHCFRLQLQSLLRQQIQPKLQKGLQEQKQVCDIQ